MKNQKMYLKLDRDKIEKERKYDYAGIIKMIDEFCDKYELQKDVNGWYSNGDFFSIGAVVLWIEKEKWLYDYIKEWLWDDGNGGVEDLVYYHIHKEAKYV